MDWQTISKMVGTAAPLLGTLLGGPAGATVGTLISQALGCENKPDAIAQALQTNPDAAVKLSEIEKTNQVQLQQIALEQTKAELQAAQANANDVSSVMIAETKAEHWPSYSWRPAIGFAVAIATVLLVLIIAMSFVGVMFFGKSPEVLKYLPEMLTAMTTVLITVTPILGIASWFRGVGQVKKG